MPGGAPAGGGSRQWAGCCCGLQKGALHSARGMWFCKVVACMAADADAVVAPHNSPGLLKDVCAIVTQVLQMLLRLLRCVRPPALFIHAGSVTHFSSAVESSWARHCYCCVWLLCALLQVPVMQHALAMAQQDTFPGEFGTGSSHVFNLADLL